ncbi:S1C family serine protease [Frankia sp. AgB32]|uniref:S1C family serine protease n=1 Tax=Frankia sp. AgB32 TaxID=631119 RepID=UPI00200E12AC|nr:trypsin-like peptidase domain-containing protein [Frankia sp. AgB32]MCK9897817.1 S1C family serine protease [Frankia sp. AgB32]
MSEDAQQRRDEPAQHPVWARPAGQPWPPAPLTQPGGAAWQPWPGPGWAAPQPLALPVPPPRRRRVPPLLLAALLLGAAGAGAGIGHEVWTPSGSTSAVSGVSGLRGGLGSGGGTSGGLPFGLGQGGGLGSSGQSPLDQGGTSDGSSGGSGTEGSGAPSDVSAIAARAAPALVDITATFSYQSSQGAGSGIVLTSSGEVLTNNHVIDGATTISATDVGNGKTYSASVVGYDSTHDIAVLQLKDASGLTAATLGDSTTAAVGQSVVAIGNAGGTGGTPTSAGGSITTLDQSITANDDLDGTAEQLSGLIEVNADVEAGDSGGALVNDSGKVIGMNTAASAGFAMTPSAQSAGNQGFAIPINQALATARQIEAGQGSDVIHVGPAAFLGVMISSSDSQGGGRGGVGVGAGSTTSAAAVSAVVDGTSAQQAGVVAGDVITSLDGHAVDSATALSTLMVTHHPGDKAQLGWVDTSGRSRTATVDLGTGPPA